MLIDGSVLQERHLVRLLQKMRERMKLMMRTMRTIKKEDRHDAFFLMVLCCRSAIRCSCLRRCG